MASIASLGLAPLAAAQRTPRRPNFVIILADDQGWGDLSVHGNTNLSTPNIDSIARDGAIFERFFVCPVCAPTRAEFLTGRYHPRGGVRGVTTGAERLNLDEHVMPQSFVAAGYATGAFGKWHNGMQHPYHPNARGIQEFYGFTSGHWGIYFDTEMDHNGELARGKGYITDDLTDHAMAFIEKNKDRNFFCYVPYNTPHSPMQVPDQYYRKFADASLKLRATDPSQEDIPHTRAALAMVENIDFNVGRLLKKLDDLKLSSNTVVLYFSDNGPNGWRWNEGMKGRKGTVDEGGVRSPLLVRWPGHIKPGTKIPQIAGAIDLYPTLTDLAGIPITSKKPLDGKSLKPLLTGQPGNWPDRMIFSVQNRRVSVRTQQYRLDPEGRLFDMKADPNQKENVAARNPEVATKLKAAVTAWSQEVLPKGPDDRAFTVGYWKTTRLPARDGVPGGSVERSGKAPNSSFFTHWVSKDDRMTWDIEVGNAGTYEAAVYYACHKGDEGSLVELSFSGENLQTRISAPHDVPLKGMEHDRTDRGAESYVKDFKRYSLGKIKLAQTRGKLTLRAIEVKGREVAEVRYVELVRV
ncbi:MAG: arylsulfatase [Acidobacteria bacterium]|nr:arylsulfatase [Acidobacteriota bacterium]